MTTLYSSRLCDPARPFTAYSTLLTHYRWRFTRTLWPFHLPILIFPSANLFAYSNRSICQFWSCYLSISFLASLWPIDHMCIRKWRNTHFRSHAGLRPFECSLCGATFTRQHSLNYHLMTHANQTRLWQNSSFVREIRRSRLQYFAFYVIPWLFCL